MEFPWEQVRWPLLITNTIASTLILVSHSYRLGCHTGQSEGRVIRVLNCITFQHTSFAMMACGLFAVGLRTVMDVIPTDPVTSDAVDRCNIVSLGCSKLALHLFVILRSQIVSDKLGVLFKIGLTMALSDVFNVFVFLSPLIDVDNVPVWMFIWFALNDLVIGTYCLFALVLPLRKFIKLESRQRTIEINIPTSDVLDCSSQSSQIGLVDLARRIVLYSSIALLSTIVFTILGYLSKENSRGVLFFVDNTVNALCVTMQFSQRQAQLRGPLGCCVSRCTKPAQITKCAPCIESVNTVDTDTKSSATPHKVKMVLHMDE